MRQVVLVLGLLALTVPAVGQCNITITDVRATDPSQRREPRVGEPYRLVVTFDVDGVPRQPYRIKYLLANRSYTEWRVEPEEGQGFEYWCQLEMPLDGPIPWTVEVDPERLTGDVRLDDNRASGSFEPRYPQEAIAAYDRRLMEATQTATLRFRPDSGPIGTLFTCFGVPTTSPYQQVIETVGPVGSEIVLVEPHQRPVHVTRSEHVDGWQVTASRRFVVETAAVRCNPRKLQPVPWSAYADLPPEVTQWVKPETWAPCDAPEIREFVAAALPADYRDSLTPYDTARRLHLAVMRHMDYQSSETPVWDALQSLEAKRGNCGNVATLLTTLVRAVGIPARTVSALGEFTDRFGHSWTEIFFPGQGWMPADATWARSEDPDGKYAYYFGVMPHLNQFAAFAYGVEHHTAEWSIDGLISPFFWTGSAKEESLDVTARLAPKRADTSRPPGL